MYFRTSHDELSRYFLRAVSVNCLDILACVPLELSQKFSGRLPVNFFGSARASYPDKLWSVLGQYSGYFVCLSRCVLYGYLVESCDLYRVIEKTLCT